MTSAIGKGGGVKNWAKLPTDSTKNCRHGGGGRQKSGKNADVVYGRPLTELTYVGIVWFVIKSGL